MIERYFSEQSSFKDVALQVVAGVCAVGAAQASARVAARRRLRSQRRRIFLSVDRSALLALDYLCHKIYKATWPLRQASRDATISAGL